MDSTSLLSTFRLDVVDVETPTLWSDDEILGYADDAQKMFCRKVHGFNDATTPSVTQLAVTTTTDVAPTSPLILKVRKAYLASDGTEIDVINYENLRQYGLRLDGRTGPVRMLVTGMTDHVAKLYPFPTVADTIQLLVERLPLAAITDVDQPLEIDSQHHRSLLLWMKHLAYDKQDAETRDPKKSADYEQRFLAYCDQARREKERANHKTRVVAYGGIGISIEPGNTSAYDRRGRSTLY